MQNKWNLILTWKQVNQIDLISVLLGRDSVVIMWPLLHWGNQSLGEHSINHLHSVRNQQHSNTYSETLHPIPIMIFLSLTFFIAPTFPLLCIAKWHWIFHILQLYVLHIKCNHFRFSLLKCFSTDVAALSFFNAHPPPPFSFSVTRNAL